MNGANLRRDGPMPHSKSKIQPKVINIIRDIIAHMFQNPEKKLTLR